MLNRRLLRTKAVQALYASRLAADSNRLLAIDEIAEAYLPDLNSMEPQNLVKLEGLKKLAVVTLDEFIKNGKPNEDDEVPLDVVRVARDAFNEYNKRTQLDRKKVVKRVLHETESIYDEFLDVLLLFVELAQQSQIHRGKEFQDPDFLFPTDSGLDSNQIITSLTESKTFQEEIIRRGNSWANEMNFVRKTYREALRNDPEYRLYCSVDKHTLEEDHQIVQHILRKVIFKHEVPLGFFEQRDLFWEDHSDLIRSLAIKTLKSAENGGALELAKFTDDWDEDQFFVEELFKQATENDDLYESYLTDQLKNWDLERVALVDMIIMKTAIAELINFSGIPVKVTINEFIEIAKRYSTPKSGKFVNGVLDMISNKLRDQGIIRKSGRGLIDNK
jgi:N utilization substance protein B